MLAATVDEAGIRHQSDCAKPSLTHYVGNRGDQIVRCRTCGRWAVAEPAAHQPVHRASPSDRPRAVTDQPQPAEEPPALRGWVCREHPTQPVNWRGRGCSTCKSAKTPTTTI